LDFSDRFYYIDDKSQKEEIMKRISDSILFSVSVLMLAGWIAAPRVRGQGLSVQITNPANGTRFALCSDILVSTDVQIQSGQVKKVQFFENNLIQGEDSKAPYEWNFRNAPSGVYQLTAKVIDNSSNEAVSQPVVISVGNVSEGDILTNGDFTCGLWPWVFNIWVAEGRATITRDPLAGIADSTALVIDVQNGGTALWNVQLSQPFPVQSGHTYTLSFYADAPEGSKTIEYSFQENKDPYTTYKSEQVAIDHLGQYGPFVFDCTADDPAANFHFNLGLTAGKVILDQIEVVDPSVSGISERGRRNDAGARPDGFNVGQNFPNPFNSSTMIEYSLPEEGFVTLDIYNVKGQRIKTLVQEDQKAGGHRTVWNGTDGLARIVPTGVYFYQLKIRTADRTRVSAKKLLLLE
jgi:hypothetical protein